MKNNKYKIFMIFSIVVLVIAIIVSSTYAYYVWTTEGSNVTKIVAGVGAATVTFDGGSDVEANLRPVSDKSKGISKKIKVKADTTGLVFNLYLDMITLDTNLKHESFKYELYKGTTKVKEGNFSTTYLNSNTSTCTKNNTTHITLLTNESISTSNTEYTLYIWIDGANYTNPSTMMNKSFSFKLHADGEGAVLKPNTADYTLKQLNALNSSIVVDTTKTPDFSTVSGNTGVKHNNNDGTSVENQGDGTKGIYVSEDDLGKSYYFRGAVENNYVKFAGFYWRIIRINGDGSIRMIYAGTSAHPNGYDDSSLNSDTIIGSSQYNTNSEDNAYVGYMYGTAGSSTYSETHKNTNNSTIKAYIDTWYKNNLINYTDYLQDSIYCNDRSVTPVESFGGMELSGNGTGTTFTAYSNLTRNFVNSPATPSLKCTNINDRFTVSSANGNGALTYPIGLITTDEIILSGGKSYDMVNSSYITNTDYYLFTGNFYWSMTPVAIAGVGAGVDRVDGDGGVGGSFVHGTNGVRSVVSLRSDVITGGNGTMNNPFVIG